jgi:hypothetical protein
MPSAHLVLLAIHRHPPSSARPAAANPHSSAPTMSYVVQAAPAQPQMQLMNVTVPGGVGPGNQMQIRTPQGQVYTVTVPPGAFPGHTFQVQLPAPAPVAVATVGVQGQVMYQQAMAPAAAPMVYHQGHPGHVHHQQHVVVQQTHHPGVYGHGGVVVHHGKHKGYKHKGHKMKGFKLGFKGFKGFKFD